jgi:uncharacterized caspase-like protein
MSKFQRVIAARWVKSLWLVALLLALTLGQRAGHAAEMRFALVIGNDEYKSTRLATPANDAGLVANALTAAGFTVTGARNLDQATLRESIREFLGQVAAAGPDAVAVIYLAGFGVQFAGENYYVPVDADLAREADLPLQAVRISDFAQPLAALPARVKIVILDAARQNPFAQGGEPLASGLALVDPAPGMAIAFNAAPGTIGPEEPGPYGAYATALTEMIAAGGLPLDDVLARVRLRVSEVTNGGEVPWCASQINTPFFFTERSADAPPPPDVAPVVDLREKPMRSYSRIEDAYAAALALDTIDGYEQFLALHPRSRYARRIAAMIAVRREEIIWRRCVFDNTPPAYWSYLRRYPNGPHVWDARRRLAMIGAELEGPPDFAFVDFGVPPPPPEELVVVDRPVVTFWGGDYEPPPPPPVFFLPPRPREFVVLPAPPPPRERYFLPTPQAAVVPTFVRPPPTVVIVSPAPAVGTAPGPVPVALPAVVSRGGAPGAPGSHPGVHGVHPGAAGTPAVLPGHTGGPPPPPPAPSSAAVTPASPPPPAPGSGPTPATVKPGTPPPAPGSAPVPATVKPGTLPPPPPPAPGSGPTPATVKPGTPPPPPAAPAPATIKPATPPPPAAPAPATIKPATPPPPPPAAPAPATIKPATPPPPPPAAPAPATIKPATPPPPPPPPPHAPAPATIKPAAPPPPPPPPPPPHPAAPAPATIKPAAPPPPPPPPPPHAPPPAPAAAKPPPPPPAAARPACPPGKTLVQVNGQPTCK